jgi:hypothetical protein
MTINPWTGKTEPSDAYLQARARAMTEAELQTCIEHAARYRGWRSYHTHDSRRSQAGFPDLVLVFGSRILWRELKSQTGRLRPEQQAWLDDLEAAGADTGIWRPIDWLDGTVERELTAPRGQRP